MAIDTPVVKLSRRLLYLVDELPKQVRVQQYVPRDRLVTQAPKNFGPAEPEQSSRSWRRLL
jgi:hypothetical protein